ncbi:meiotic recombination protein REC8 homolog isoform X2 [Chrysemys picta bellii]|uniref:meiotic recombination protein REC8 homolog isoform X2 n=1 Tax=Chrysemys picta bellii TaxID=8478 RepID=UPI0032B13AA1
MGDLEQPGLLLPDNLLLMEVLEDAPDPFFGVMEPPLPSPTDIPQVPPVLPLPSPTDIPQIRCILEAPTPPERPAPSPRRRRAEAPPITVVSPEIITMKEVEPIILLEIEGERDLPEITAREIDLLAEQEDFVLPPASPRTPPRRRPMEEPEEEMRAREAEITVRLSPPTRVGEEPPAEVETPILPEELARLPKEEVPPPPELSPPREPGLPPPPPSPAVTPRVTRPPSSPKLELAVYEPAPPRTPRRQLRFLDEVTQIPRDQFKKQILDVRAQCRPLVVVEVPARQRRTPAELLRAPTYGWLPPELLALWQRCAILQPVDYAALWAEEERKEEPISELEVAREALEPSIPVMVSSGVLLMWGGGDLLQGGGQGTWLGAPCHKEGTEWARWKGGCIVGTWSGAQGKELEGVPCPREEAGGLTWECREGAGGGHCALGRGSGAFSPLHQQGQCGWQSGLTNPCSWPLAEISLETTEEEVPRPSLVTPEERRLMPEPEEALPIVPELPEVSLELPPDRDLITLEYIRRLVAAELEQVGETDFRSLVPTTTSRSIASRIFYLCLVLCGLQFLQLDQAEPYGPILLKRGARFHSG